MPKAPKPSTAVVVSKDEPSPLDPAWDGIRQTIATVRATGRAYLFGQAWLGWQLAVRKEEHRKAGGGRGGDRKSMGQSGPLVSWEAIVARELGLPKRTADRFIELFDAAKAKLKRTAKKTPASVTALSILQSENPLALPADQREMVQDVIASLCDGETQASLMEELNVVPKPPAPPVGKKTKGGSEDDESPEQLAFHFWDGPTSAIVKARSSSEYKKLLYLLPAVSDDPEKPSLTFIRAEVAAMLDDLNEALATHAKSAKPKAKP